MSGPGENSSGKGPNHVHRPLRPLRPRQPASTESRDCLPPDHLTSDKPASLGAQSQPDSPENTSGRGNGLDAPDRGVGNGGTSDSGRVGNSPGTAVSQPRRRGVTFVHKVRSWIEAFVRYNFSRESLGPVSRREAASFTVAALAVGYVITPVAFYYGATGQIFFQNLMLIWVGSIVALMVRGVVGTTTDGKRHFTWTSSLILALPSVWLVALLLDLQGALLSFVDLGMGLLSLPYILWVMFRAAVPEAVRVRSRRLVLGFVLILGVVSSCAFGLGKNHHRFLNCEDFTISGAYAPSNCVKSDSKDALP